MSDKSILDMINEKNFVTALTNEIYGIIDEEMLKGDEMNCELVDSLVEALEILQEEDAEKVFGMIPFIIDSGKIKSKLNHKQSIMKITALAASLALVFSGVNSVLVNTKSTTLISEINAFFNNIKELFGIEHPEEATTEETTAAVTKPSEAVTDDEFFEDVTDYVIDKNDVFMPYTPANSQNEATSQALELVTGDNFKNSYLWGEAFDTTGLSVYLVSSNGDRELISTDKVKFTGFKPSVTGEQTVTAEYGGLKAQFTVTVSKTPLQDKDTRVITGVSVNMPEMIYIYVIEDDIKYKKTSKSYVSDFIIGKYTNGKKPTYRYKYSDGTFSHWYNLYEKVFTQDVAYTPHIYPDVTDFDNPQTLVFDTPEGKQVTFTVQFYYAVNDAEGVGISANNIKTVAIPSGFIYCRYDSDSATYYYKKGDKLDIGELEFSVKYLKLPEGATSLTRTLSTSDEGVKVYGFDGTDKVGKHTVRIVYSGLSIYYNYVVIDESASITSYSFNNDWHLYYNGGAIEPTYTAKYKSDSSTIIENAPAEFSKTGLVKGYVPELKSYIYLNEDDIEIEGYDPTKVGYIVLDIYYKGEYLGKHIGGYIYGDDGFVPYSRPSCYYENKEYEKRTVEFWFLKSIGGGKFLNYTTFENAESSTEITGTTDLNMLTTAPLFDTYYDGTKYRTDNIDNLLLLGKRIVIDTPTPGKYTVPLTVYGIKWTIVDYEIYEEEIENEDGSTQLVETQIPIYDYVRDETVQYIFDYDVTVSAIPVWMSAVTDGQKALYHTDNLKEELLDSIHYYMRYSDGRKEEITDYTVSYIIRSGSEEAFLGDITVQYHDIENDLIFESKISKVYLCESGYEESFYLELLDNKSKNEVKTVYIKQNTNNYDFTVQFLGAGERISDVTNVSKFENFDTSELGAYTGTVVYRNSLGEFRKDFNYVVIPEQPITPQLSATVRDTRLLSRFDDVPEDFDILVEFTNEANEVIILSRNDYTIEKTYSNGTKATVTFIYTDPVTDKTYSYRTYVPVCGTLHGFTVFRNDETGEYTISVDADIEENVDYDVIVNVYDAKQRNKPLNFLGTVTEHTLEFTVSDELMPSWKYEYFIEVQIITYPPDGSDPKKSSFIEKNYNYFSQ